MDELKAINEELINALDHIARTARASRTQTRRSRWIVSRAESAIDMNDGWRDLDLPKSLKDCSPRRIKYLEDKIRDLEGKCES